MISSSSYLTSSQSHSTSQISSHHQSSNQQQEEKSYQPQKDGDYDVTYNQKEDQGMRREDWVKLTTENNDVYFYNKISQISQVFFF